MLGMKNRKKNQLFQLICNSQEDRQRAEKLFWGNVYRDPNGCWEWDGPKTSGGRYGLFRYKKFEEYFYASSHRFSLMLHTGRDEVYLDACHRCDNPPCVRPDHLFWGTAKQNMIDKVIKFREKNGKLSISEDTAVRACQIYEKNLEELGKYKAMHLAIQLALNEIFKGDLDKTYRQEIKSLKSGIALLMEEVMR